MIRVALDAMGGDRAPAAPVEGARAALAEFSAGELEVLLVGDPALLEPLLADGPDAGWELVPAREQILAEEAPALAVRRKRDSSIVVGLEAVRDGRADAFISAGSTGAVMAASLLTLGPLPGVDRPPVGALFPTSRGRVLVLDAGATVDARPDQLHQFARLGAIYASDLLGIERPCIGLLNVGEEEEKGGEVTVAAHRLLREDPSLRFVGNVEGHRIIAGDCDVVVCDGFVGNALLKFYESMAGFVLGLLRDRFGGERRELEELFRFLDYAEYGGAPLLGVDGVAIICHGASSPRAIKNAIRVAVQSVRTDMVRDMERDLEALAAGAPT